MSMKKVSPEMQRRNKKRKRVEADEAADRRATEATENDGPELNEQPKRADVESLRQLRTTIAKFEKGYRAQLLWILAQIYQQGWDLQTGSMKVWCTFLAEDFFTGKKLSSPKKERINLFKLLCEYSFNTKTALDRKRTCKFSKTLHYYHYIGVEPDDLMAEIKKAGGLEKAYKLSVEYHKARLSKKSGAVSTKEEVVKSSENDSTIESEGSFEEEEQQLNNDMDFKVEKEPKKSAPLEKFVMKTKLRNRLHDMQQGEEVRLICIYLGNGDQGQAIYKVCRAKRTKNR